MTQGSHPSPLDRGQALHLAEALAASKSEFERMAHARALANLGPSAAAAAAPRLAQMLTVREPGSAAAAAFVLCEIGPAALAYAPRLPEDLTAQLGHWDGEVRHWAAAALGRVAPDSPEAVTRLRALLKDPDEGVCLAALYAIEAMGAAAGECLEDLAELLSHGRPGIRRAAVRAMAAAAMSHRAQAAALLRASLESDQGAARLAAAAGLLLIEDAEMTMAALRVLEEALEDQRSNRRREVFAAISLLPQPGEGVMALLGKNLIAESDAELRSEAAHLIRRWAPHAAPLRDALLSALNDPDDRVRQTAALSLSDIPQMQNDAEAALVLSDHVNDPSVPVRAAALSAYAHAEPSPDLAAAALQEALQSPETTVRLAAVGALSARSGLSARRETLEACLNDDSSEVRIAAARALLAAGAPGPGFSALHEALESSELATQAKALQALNDAGPLPENVRRTLAELREQGHTTLREAAAKLLALQEGA